MIYLVRGSIYTGMFVFCIVASILTWMYYTQYSSQLEMENIDFEATISRLVDIDNFREINITTQTFSHTAYGKTCYYKRAFIIMGTHFESIESLNSYSKELLLQGWTLDGLQYGQTKILKLEPHYRIVIDLNEPEFDIEKTTNFDVMRSNYNTVIFIKLDFVMPGLLGC